MHRSELGEVFHTESPRNTPVQQDSITSAFNMQAFRLIGAVFLSYNSGPNRLKHAHMRRIRRSISSQRSAFSWMMPPSCKNWVVCLYLWPAATSDGAVGVRSRVCNSIVSVFFSDTVRPAVSKTVTMSVISLASASADFETIPASSANNIPYNALCTRANGTSFPLTTSSSRCTKFLMSSSSLKRTRTTCITAAKSTLNSNGDSKQPCRSPCVASNDSGCSQGLANILFSTLHIELFNFEPLDRGGGVPDTVPSLYACVITIKLNTGDGKEPSLPLEPSIVP